jgi:hypothetical protein
MAALAVTSVFAAGAGVAEGATKSREDVLATSLGRPVKDVKVLAAAGLNDNQIRLMMLHPERVPTSWTTTETHSANVTESTVAPNAGAPVADGPTFSTTATTAGVACGWTNLNHDGSAFGIRTARINLHVDWCWNGAYVVGTPTHYSSSSVTAYGSAGGWRLNGGPYDASNYPDMGMWYNRVHQPWTLVAGGYQVNAGTAWLQQRSQGNGTFYKTAGGWP